jgi:hypothetical protein
MLTLSKWRMASSVAAMPPEREAFAAERSLRALPGFPRRRLRPLKARRRCFFAAARRDGCHEILSPPPHYREDA